MTKTYRIFNQSIKFNTAPTRAIAEAMTFPAWTYDEHYNRYLIAVSRKTSLILPEILQSINSCTTCAQIYQNKPAYFDRMNAAENRKADRARRRAERETRRRLIAERNEARRRRATLRTWIQTLSKKDPRRIVFNQCDVKGISGRTAQDLPSSPAAYAVEILLTYLDARKVRWSATQDGVTVAGVIKCRRSTIDPTQWAIHTSADNIVRRRLISVKNPRSKLYSLIPDYKVPEGIRTWFDVMESQSYTVENYTTPEDIADAYEDTQESSVSACMSYPASKWFDGIHPCTAYGGSHENAIHLLIIRKLGSIIGRCVYNATTGEAGRLYSSDSNVTAIQTAIRRAFPNVHSAEQCRAGELERDTLQDARFNVVPLREGYAFPYWDLSSGSAFKKVFAPGTATPYFMMAESETPAGFTEGTERFRYLGHSDSRLLQIGTPQLAHHNTDDDDDDDDDETTICYSCDEREPTHNGTTDGHGNWYCEGCAESLVYCERSEECWPGDETYTIEASRGNHRTFHESFVTRND